MRTAICYYSQHHGNTRQVVQAMAQEGGVDLFDLSNGLVPDLRGYELVGLGSGLYRGRFHGSVVSCAKQGLVRGQRVFFVCTYGQTQSKIPAGDIEIIAAQKGCAFLGGFACRGYNTAGIYWLLGGTAQGRPNGEDLAAARQFLRRIRSRY